MSSNLRFPQGFKWGAATSAHQVEGNNINNQWWEWEQKLEFIRDGTVSGRACDHYCLYEQDFDLAQKLGHQVYRMSIEWSRIEPSEGKWNLDEVNHYRHVIEALHARDIVPMVTCHHFTNPLWLEEQGAWLNSKSCEYFERFVRFLGEQFGDIVSYWNTINEPMIVVLAGYLVAEHPPCHSSMDEAGIVARHLLQAHGRAYHALHETVVDAGHPSPIVGIVKNMMPGYPLDQKNPVSVQASETYNTFYNQWFLDSLAQGQLLPPFGDGSEVHNLQNAWDFIGLNYYHLVYVKDLTLNRTQLENWPKDKPEPERTDLGSPVTPEGLYEVLKFLSSYNRPIWITENGLATTDDEFRNRYLLSHLRALHQAIGEGVDVRGYLHWSLMDNFEWREGRCMRFGLIEIDYETLERRIRRTAFLFRDIIKANTVTSEQLASLSEIE